LLVGDESTIAPRIKKEGCLSFHLKKEADEKREKKETRNLEEAVPSRERKDLFYRGRAKWGKPFDTSKVGGKKGSHL